METASDVGFRPGQTAPITTADVASQAAAARDKRERDEEMIGNLMEVNPDWSYDDASLRVNPPDIPVPREETGVSNRVPSGDGVGDVVGIADPADPYDWLGGPGLDLDDRAGTVVRRAWDETKSQQEELRRQTPEELAQDEYWGTRAQDARDDARSRLYADVAGAISGSGGVRGNIGKGLKEAIYGQIEQMDLARDFEGLPITAAATRSRGSTFEAQQKVLENVYTALTSRGETDALIEGRLQEVRDSLAQAGRMTPDNMAKFHSLLMEGEVRGLISEEGMKAAVRQLLALGARDIGMTIPFLD
jgi:hypothetical protein